MDVYYRKVYKIGPFSISVYKSGWLWTTIKGMKLSFMSRSVYIKFDSNFTPYIKRETNSDLYNSSIYTK
jgi:hypothetical protein